VVIDKALVLRVAELAHLNLTDEEAAIYEQQLQEILSYVEQLNTLDDSRLPNGWRSDVMNQPLPERKDEAKASLPVEQVIDLAPEKTGSAFQVPRIIE